MKKIKEFLSCDWGTTSFRLRLVSYPEFRIVAEESSNEGIAHTFDAWKAAGSVEEERFSHYLSVIHDHLVKLEKQLGFSTGEIPLIISGMASSSIGMTELPYKPFPFSIDGSDLEVKTILPTTDLNHPIILISGAKTEDDVMRGEETQLIGCSLLRDEEEQLFIHPGTHSKHVVIKNGKATSFKTFMTGEFFALLTSESILSVSVRKSDNLQHPLNKQSFGKGVKASLAGNILHETFLVRTNDLFGKLSKDENYFFLSGLLIGTELQDFRKGYSGRITLSGHETLMALYLEAFRVLGIIEDPSAITIKNAEEVTFRGQYEIFRQLHNLI